MNLAIKALLKLSNTSVREARHMLAVHSPLTYQPLIPKERLMVIAGAGDRLAPPKHARLLWDHWDRPPHPLVPGQPPAAPGQGQVPEGNCAVSPGNRVSTRD